MYMGKSFKDSLKLLEADIQHANALASDFRRERDGACLRMRMSLSPAAHLFLFLVHWADCHLAGALGLLRVLICKVYVDGTTTMSIHQRKASIREFYAIIYPSSLQLQGGLCWSRFSNIEFERDDDCGICMEPNDKVVLPNCSHVLCVKCYHGWRARSQSCPFCRDSLERFNSKDLWVFMDSRDIIDMATITRDNLHRLLAFVDKLPMVIPGNHPENYNTHLQ